ncbi:sigma-54-dependent Fis family transcriptional regulator [Alkalilimnicola ehrlichii MLHE-1]|uniref:GAF modulated sigma54 specific transcriptional regulator, Fis family n=1 Tax=Alkalilimnicola ehrlichii (strain ATCC BAA-1101 / DSM 17681 / MLHE-1) TaxID=187272 RepID=Q0A9V6_ALKEH|nr:sigma-54-dependent Fis family transcriptional regulator [Alkalilimnicola ehrlichii]ABI56381.1 GAF modulated sigma54 specific transcriptional regulator, Fis family [Alkalilimnicola ehrlichii MLHE-1]
MQDRRIYQAWESFLSQGETPTGVRDEVLASWQRSLDNNVPVDRSQTQALSDGEFLRVRQQSGPFLTAARPALEQGRRFLSEARAMVMLSNAHGTVLETVGDRRVIEHGQDIGLCRGGLWDEGHIGTNAIGTALASQQPVQIHGYEHYCCRVQRWTCAAAPVFSPTTRRILGVVDLSGPAESFNPQSLAYVVAVARQIEGGLIQATEADHRRLIDRFLGMGRRWKHRDVLVVSRSGVIVHGNEQVRRQISRASRNLFFENTIPLLRDTPAEEWLDKLHAQLPTADIEPVTVDGEHLGVILAPRQGRTGIRPRNRDMGEHPSDGFSLDTLIGDSPAMRAACDKARRLAATDAPILIEGETGVGKELFAQGIHALSMLTGPFIPVNCGALPKDLIGGEMFGYVGGAFTGASQEGRPGKLEAADGGTLCLDEVSEMPLDLQPTLLRILEDGVVYRIGSHQPRRVRARLLSMTNRNLPEEIESGRFRQDLFYRIAALRLRIPPLRERGDDIALLAEYYLRQQATRSGRTPQSLSAEAMDALLRYHWPGNVRQLRNAITTTAALTDAATIDVEALPEEILTPAPAPTPGEDGNLQLATVERAAIEQALRRCEGNVSRAARQLGIARSTLYCRIQEQHIPIPRRRRTAP